MRLLIATLVAPLATGFIVLIISLLSGTLRDAGWAFMFTSLIAYAVMLVFGLPTHFGLKRFGYTKLWLYLVAGFLLSIIPIIYFVIYPRITGPHEVQIYYSDIVISAGLTIASMLTVFVFWIIARPDRA